MSLPPYRPIVVHDGMSPADVRRVELAALDYLQRYAAALPDWERRLAAVEEYVEDQKQRADDNYEDSDA